LIEATVKNTPFGKVYKTERMEVKVNEEHLTVMFVPCIDDEEKKAAGIQSFIMDERTPGEYPRVYKIHNEDGMKFELRIHNPEGLHGLKTKLEFKTVRA
jgi:hypothetical protein